MFCPNYSLRRNTQQQYWLCNAPDKMQLCDCHAVSKTRVPDLSGHWSHFALQHKVRDSVWDGHSAPADTLRVFIFFIRTGQNTWQHSSGRQWMHRTYFIPSSRASLYTKREQFSCHLELCWLCCVFLSSIVSVSQRQKMAQLATSPQHHPFLSVLFNAIWISELGSSWKKALNSSLAHVLNACVDFPLEVWLMQKRLEELSPWIRWENS